jgi:hypothetical protein
MKQVASRAPACSSKILDDCQWTTRIISPQTEPVITTAVGTSHLTTIFLLMDIPEFIINFLHSVGNGTKEVHAENSIVLR